MISNLTYLCRSNSNWDIFYLVLSGRSFRALQCTERDDSYMYMYVCIAVCPIFRVPGGLSFPELPRNLRVSRGFVRVLRAMEVCLPVIRILLRKFQRFQRRLGFRISDFSPPTLERIRRDSRPSSHAHRTTPCANTKEYSTVERRLDFIRAQHRSIQKSGTNKRSFSAGY